jgi:hypothetical protein
VCVCVCVCVCVRVCVCVCVRVQFVTHSICPLQHTHTQTHTYISDKGRRQGGWSVERWAAPPSHCDVQEQHAHHPITRGDIPCRPQRMQLCARDACLPRAVLHAHPRVHVPDGARRTRGCEHSTRVHNAAHGCVKGVWRGCATPRQGVPGTCGGVWAMRHHPAPPRRTGEGVGVWVCTAREAVSFPTYIYTNKHKHKHRVGTWMLSSCL